MEPDKGHQKTNRSLKYFHGEAAASSLENAGAAYQSPSLVASGATAQEVAFFASLSNLILSLLLIRIPSLLNSCASHKRIVLILSLLSAITWLPLILVLFFFGKISPYWLIGLWLLSLVPTLLIGPLRDNWLAETVPSRRMGRYLSLRSAISGAAFLGFFYFMGYILDSSREGIFRGYATVLAIAFIGSLFSVFLYKMIKAPPKEAEDNSSAKFTFPDFIKEARHGNLGRFIVYVSSLGFAVYLCSAFFTVYMLRDLHFTYLIYTIVISSEFFARVISLPFWGKVVDRSGSMRVLKIVSWLIPTIPVLWLFSHSLAYLVIIQLISGMVWSAHDLCNQTLIYRAAPKEKRLRYIVYHKSLTTFAMAAGALVGAFALNYVFPMFGSRILGLFLVSGILRFVIVLIMFPRKHGETEEQIDEGETTLTAVLDSTLAYVPSCFGLHDRLERGLDYNKSSAIPVFSKVFVNIDTVAPRGVFYHPEEWVEYIKPSQNVRPTVKIIPPLTGLFYHPDEWQEYIKNISVRKSPTCRYSLEQVKNKPLKVVFPPKVLRPETVIS